MRIGFIALLAADLPPHVLRDLALGVRLLPQHRDGRRPQLVPERALGVAGLLDLQSQGRRRELELVQLAAQPALRPAVRRLLDLDLQRRDAVAARLEMGRESDVGQQRPRGRRPGAALRVERGARR